MPRILPALAALVLFAAPLTAQLRPVPLDSVHPGQKVRVTTTDGARTGGRLAPAPADSIVLQNRRGTTTGAFSTAAVTRLQVSAGRARKESVLGGATAGVLLGVLYTELAPAPRDPVLGKGFDRFSNSIVGAFYGAIAGWFLAPHHWRRVLLGDR
jgi:hypothetical protein